MFMEQNSVRCSFPNRALHCLWCHCCYVQLWDILLHYELASSRYSWEKKTCIGQIPRLRVCSFTSQSEFMDCLLNSFLHKPFSLGLGGQPYLQTSPTYLGNSGPTLYCNICKIFFLAFLLWFCHTTKNCHCEKKKNLFHGCHPAEQYSI
jgi:hypothetical protein